MKKNTNNLNKCMVNSISAKACMLKMLKSPSNWVVVILTYMIWSLVGMRYSTNQNFNMAIAQQNYVMLLSLVSIVMALMNHQTKLVKLALIGSVTFVLSFITLAADKVGIIWLGYPIGYYLLCPITLFLSLMQIKQICSFACFNYYGSLNTLLKESDSATDNTEALDTRTQKQKKMKQD
jgi:hypothetical protein